MFQTTAIIRNGAGIHCRPSAILVKEGSAYTGRINVISPSGTCNLKSALELIMLGLEQHTQITIQVEGPDEEEFSKKLAELFETEFDFSPL